MAFKVNNETKVGALAAVAITILVLGYNFLAGRDSIWSTGKIYYAYFEDLDGLSKSNPIMFKGYKIGQVSDLRFDDQKNAFLVEFDIQKNIAVTEGTVASIADADLFGTKAIKMDIKPNSPVAKNNSFLQGKSEAGMLASLGNTFGPIAGKIDSLVATLNNTLSSAAFQGTLVNLERTTKNLIALSAKLDKVVEQNEEKINGVFANVLSITQNLEKNNQTITQILRNADSFSANLNQLQLKETIAAANKSIASFNDVLEKVNNGDGSLALLLKDPKLYNNLDKVSVDLNKLIIDINSYPKRYFSIGSGKKAETKRQKDIDNGSYKPE